jgi:hypothetical protein
MSQQPSEDNTTEGAAHLITTLFLPADDLTATVLRGHLAVERRLTAKLERCFPYPQALNLSRQPFSQLARLAQAFTYREDNAWLWKAISALTEARNYLAHDLDAPDLAAKVERFVACAEVHHRTLQLTTYDGNLLSQLRSGIAFVCGALETRHLWRDTGAYGR